LNLSTADYFHGKEIVNKPYVLYPAQEITKFPSLILVVAAYEHKEYYVSILSLDRLTRQFDKDMIYSNFLLDNKGKSYIKNEEAKNFDPSKEKYIQDILSSNTDKGTREVEGSNREKKIVAFSRLTNFNNMLILSEISKEKAFTASRYLIRKSIFFGMMLVGIAIFLGVLFSISITNPIKALLKGTQEIAKGNFTEKTVVNTNDELGVLSDSFNLMSDEIVRLMEQTAEKARMEKELETAQTVQNTLFPESKTTIGNVQITGHYHPASECGGDWWFYSPMGERVFYWIGDATGHGVSAALVTSAARAAASIIENFPDIAPGKALGLLNNAICDTSKGKMLMTFSSGVMIKIVES